MKKTSSMSHPPKEGDASFEMEVSNANNEETFTLEAIERDSQLNHRSLLQLAYLPVPENKSDETLLEKARNVLQQSPDLSLKSGTLLMQSNSVYRIHIEKLKFTRERWWEIENEFTFSALIRAKDSSHNRSVYFLYGVEEYIPWGQHRYVVNRRSFFDKEIIISRNQAYDYYYKRSSELLNSENVSIPIGAQHSECLPTHLDLCLIEYFNKNDTRECYLECVDEKVRVKNREFEKALYQKLGVPHPVL